MSYVTIPEILNSSLFIELSVINTLYSLSSTIIFAYVYYPGPFLVSVAQSIIGIENCFFFFSVEKFAYEKDELVWLGSVC